MKSSGLPLSFILWEHKLCNDKDEQCVSRQRQCLVLEKDAFGYMSGHNGSIQEVLIATIPTKIFILTDSLFSLLPVTCHFSFVLFFSFVTFPLTEIFLLGIYSQFNPSPSPLRVLRLPVLQG